MVKYHIDVYTINKLIAQYLNRFKTNYKLIFFYNLHYDIIRVLRLNITQRQ